MTNPNFSANRSEGSYFRPGISWRCFLSRVTGLCLRRELRSDFLLRVPSPPSPLSVLANTAGMRSGSPAGETNRYKAIEHLCVCCSLFIPMLRINAQKSGAKGHGRSRDAPSVRQPESGSTCHQPPLVSSEHLHYSPLTCFLVYLLTKHAANARR